MWYRAVIEQLNRKDIPKRRLFMLCRTVFFSIARHWCVVASSICVAKLKISTVAARGQGSCSMQARVPQEQLDELVTNDEVQKHFGVARDARSNPQQRAAHMEFLRNADADQERPPLGRGLCQLESGRPDAAVEWFQKRTLEVWPDGPWAPLARYDLARTYEMLGKYSEAQRTPP